MNELTTLSTLAVEINLLNEQVEHHKNQAVIYAARTGVKLNEVKEGLGSDKAKFVAWLEANCTVKKTAAYNYIRLSKDMPFLLDSLVPLTGLPNLTQAIELLSAPDEVKTEVTAKIEAGEDVTIKEIQRLKKEAADLLSEKNAIQNDLIDKTQRLDDAISKVQFQALTVDAIEKQNGELRNELVFKVEAKVEELVAGERAKLILENQEAIAQAKRQASDAQDDLLKLQQQKDSEIECLKREQDKAVSNAVGKKMLELDNEIRSKEQSILSLEKRTAELNATKNLLNKEVGAIQLHKQIIEGVKKDLSSLAIGFADAFDTGTIPNEVTGDWSAIYDALSKLLTQIAEWRGNSALIGELVD